jgi:glycosyltransferase involved in cell wall biosynthesis
VHAFAAVTIKPPARLLLVGDGPLRGTLEQQACVRGLAERVHFTGTVIDPRECYRAMDVFALSSDTEQMPLVILEAMATGLPIVSTDVGDVRDMVAPENQGMVVPRDDETAYAARLAILLREPCLRWSLGTANREECQRRFGLKTMIDSYQRLYSDLLQTERS